MSRFYSAIALLLASCGNVRSSGSAGEPARVITIGDNVASNPSYAKSYVSLLVQNDGALFPEFEDRDLTSHLGAIELVRLDRAGDSYRGLADNLGSLYLWMLAAGFVGGKLFYVWTSPGEFEDIKRTQGLMATLGKGFVFYGSLIFCLPVLWWWLRKRKLPVLDSIDTMILAAPIMPEARPSSMSWLL